MKIAILCALRFRSSEQFASIQLRGRGKNRCSRPGKYSIPWFVLLYVDLYPLENKIKKGCSEDEVVEATDIGGITLIRNAVKGRRIVLTRDEHREIVLDSINRENDVSDVVRRKLWSEAEKYCATYCLSSARNLAHGKVDGMIGTISNVLRYGENPYQSVLFPYNLLFLI